MKQQPSSILAHFHRAKAHGLLHAVKMATNDQSTFRLSGSDVNQKTIRAIVSGMVSVVDVLEHHNYTIPDYPVKTVELIHVKLKDDDNVFDAFMQASSSSFPVPGDIYVQRGFFLQVLNTAT